MLFNTNTPACIDEGVYSFFSLLLFHTVIWKEMKPLCCVTGMTCKHFGMPKEQTGSIAGQKQINTMNAFLKCFHISEVVM